MLTLPISFADISLPRLFRYFRHWCRFSFWLYYYAADALRCCLPLCHAAFRLFMLFIRYWYCHAADFAAFACFTLDFWFWCYWFFAIDTPFRFFHFHCFSFRLFRLVIFLLLPPFSMPFFAAFRFHYFLISPFRRCRCHFLCRCRFRWYFAIWSPCCRYYYALLFADIIFRYFAAWYYALRCPLFISFAFSPPFAAFAFFSIFLLHLLHRLRFRCFSIFFVIADVFSAPAADAFHFR